MGGRWTIRDLAAFAAGFSIAAAAVTPLALHWLTNQPDQRLVDLDVYRSGGQAVLHGLPVYGFLTQPPQLLPFTYPPFAVLLAVPLAFVSWAVAQWLWVVLVFVALAVAVRYAFAGLLGRFPRWAPVLAGVLVALCAYPTPLRDQVRFGQVDVILLAMCVADCAAARTRWPRGVLVGLATAIKLVPGIFLVYFWITGRRREAVTAAATAAVVTLGTFLVLPADSADYWFGALFDGERVGANAATTNQSIRGMLLRLHLPGPATTLIWLALAAAVAYLGLRAARRLALAGHEIGGVAVTGLVAVLVSPVSWIHHLAYLVVVLGALTWDWRAAAVAWAFFVVPLPQMGSDMLAHHVGPRFAGSVVQDSFGLAALALLVLLARRAPGMISQSFSADTSRDGVRVDKVGS
jgi:alpha-1,2-mannosyltransferase